MNRVQQTNRVAWISILQAITIMAVLIGHIDLAGDMNPNYPIACWIDRIQQGFQMPVFFFISGFLFVRSKLYQKPHFFLGGVMKSKIKRLVTPFLFMSIIMWGFKLCLPPSMLEHPVTLSWGYAFNVFFAPWNGPVRHLWFVETLFIFFLLMPLYKWTLNNRWSTALWIIILIGLTYHPYRFFGINLKSDYSKILCLEKDCTFWLFFYLGMVVQKYNVIRFVQNKWMLLISCSMYCFNYVHPIGIRNIIGIIGIVYIVSLSYVIAQRLPSLLSSFSKYTYQIYLFHMLPIMAVKFLYHSDLIDDNIWFPMCWVVSLLSAIYLPTIVSRIAEKCPKSMRILIGL